MNAAKVIGLSAGGHARVVIEALRGSSCLQIIGLLDPDHRLHGTEVLDIPVLGNDDLLPGIREQGVSHAFLGVGSCRPSMIRFRLFERLRQLGFDVVPTIHPDTTVSPSAQLGAGPTLLARSVINAGVRIGDNVLINTGAIVEHDCCIGDHAHIAPGACLAGAVTVGEGAHVGLMAAVREGVRIGRFALIGAGAVVVRDVPECAIILGVPGRQVGTIDPRKIKDRTEGTFQVGTDDASNPSLGI